MKTETTTELTSQVHIDLEKNGQQHSPECGAIKMFTVFMSVKNAKHLFSQNDYINMLAIIDRSFSKCTCNAAKENGAGK